MTRFFRFTPFVLAGLLAAYQPVLAQNDPRAEAILDAVSKKYAATPAYRANFTFTVENGASDSKDNYTGDLVVKGSKYRLKAGGQEIINNGTTIWTIIHDAKEVNVSTYEPEADDINPSQIFRIYENGYKYLFLEETRDKGVAYEVIDLIPEKRDQQVFKVRLTIVRADKSIRNLRMFEKNGSRTRYTVNRFAPDPTVDDKTFVFDKSQYKNYEVIDLR